MPIATFWRRLDALPMPRLTLITVAWNAAPTIADTMDSVAAQGFTDHEHLVIDGASTDATVEIVRQHSTARTRMVSEPDQGIYDAMNKGLALAQGDYVGFLNADDFLVRTDALALVAAATQGDPPAVAGAVAIVDQHAPGRCVRSYSATHFAPWMLRFGHMPPHPGFHMRRDIAAEIGFFDTSLRISADFDWMLRFHIAKYRARAIPETLVAVREGGASNAGFLSRRTIAREAAAACRKRGILTAAPLMWAKYGVKALQYVIPAHGFPAPAPHGWQPGS